MISDYKPGQTDEIVIDKRLQMNLRRCGGDEKRISHRKGARAEAARNIAHLEQDRRLFSFVERRTKACFSKLIYQRPREAGRNVRLTHMTEWS